MLQEDDISRYKRLLDKGVITQDEFNEAKARLLESNSSQYNSESLHSEAYTDSIQPLGKRAPAKKSSPVLGIIALITSLVFMHFISIPLAIIDLKKRGKNACSIIALVISTIWIVLIIAALVSPDEAPSTNSEASATEITINQTTENVTDDVTEAASGDTSEDTATTAEVASVQSTKESSFASEDSSSENTTKNSSDYEYDYRFVLTDDTLRSNYESACKAIDMNTEEIDLFSQVEDWAGGQKYTFDYKGKMYILYCNADSTINSISTKDLQKLYEEGYVPFSVDDYLAGKSIPNDSERKKTQTDSHSKTSSNGVITIKDGELGEYGKTVTLDGSDYINYYVPAGSYTVTNLGKYSKLFIASDKYFTNSDGYQENEIIDTVQLTENAQTANITVKEGSHIELVVASYVSLTPIN